MSRESCTSGWTRLIAFARLAFVGSRDSKSSVLEYVCRFAITRNGPCHRWQSFFFAPGLTWSMYNQTASPSRILVSLSIVMLCSSARFCLASSRQ